MTGHFERVKADRANGQRESYKVSLPAIRTIVAVVAVLASASWGLFMFIRSMDQHLIAQQMERTNELIEAVDRRAATADEMIYRELQHVQTKQEEIKDELRIIRSGP
jgi:hypothetical protein